MPVLAITILLLSIGVVGANSLLLSPISVAVGQDLGRSAGEVMQATGAYGLGVAAAALLLAPRADRIGADRSLRRASALLALSFGLSAFAPSLSVLMLAQALAGLGGGMALPAIYTLAAEIAPEGRQTRVMGAVLTGWMLAMVGGVLAAALITDLFGWRWVYATLTASMAALWLLQGRLLGLSRPSGAASSPLSALRVSGIWRGLGVVGLFMIAFYVPYFFLGAEIEGVQGHSTSTAGLLAMIYGVGFGASVLLDPLLERLGSRRAQFIGFALLVPIYLAVGLGSGRFWGFAVLMALWGFINHAVMNVIVARLTALDPGQRGAVMGLYSALTYLAVFAAPLIGAALFGHGYWLLGLFGALAAGLAALEALLPRGISAGGAQARTP